VLNLSIALKEKEIKMDYAWKETYGSLDELIHNWPFVKGKGWYVSESNGDVMLVTEGECFQIFAWDGYDPRPDIMKVLTFKQYKV
jgi:hypothetical protein